MKEVYEVDNKSNDALAVWQFLNDMQIGDIVYAKKGTYHIIGRGVVEADYLYDDSLDDTRNSQFDKPADISNPFWHLQSDGFWHLQYMDKPQEGVTPSKRWLKEKVSYATFDDDLWVLLQNIVWRLKLRDYIVEHKLTDDSWLGKIAAEGLGAIAALLLAA